MDEKWPINPALADIFKTAISNAKPKSGEVPPPPRIMVRGNGNVIAWGGSVHMHGSGLASAGEAL